MAKKRYFKTKDKQTVAILAALLIMGLLFYSSSQPYKAQSSIPLLENLLKDKPWEDWLRTIHFSYAGQEISVYELGYFKFLEFFIRKFAHFMSYFALAYAWVYGLVGKTKAKKMAYFLAFLLTVGYASFDEFHQSLTPDRTPLLQDVILDAAGGLTGLAFFGLTSWFNKHF